MITRGGGGEEKSQAKKQTQETAINPAEMPWPGFGGKGQRKSHAWAQTMLLRGQGREGVAADVEVCPQLASAFALD